MKLKRMNVYYSSLKCGWEFWPKRVSSTYYLLYPYHCNADVPGSYIYYFYFQIWLSRLHIFKQS